MIPKTPSSYRISEPIRTEILALMEDLQLVFVRKSFAPIIPDSRFVHEYRPLPKLVKPCESKRISCADFAKRNHSHVHKTNHDKAQYTISWD